MASDRLCGNEDDDPCTRQSSETQRLKPIHIPRVLAAGPFLQYPRLTPGQRRYLCSVARVRSAEHVRRLIQQHYLNVLWRCTQEDPLCPFKESRSEEVNRMGKECVQMDSGVTPGSRTPIRRREDGGDGSVAALHSVAALPKIPVRKARKASRPLASKEKKTRKGSRKVPAGASVKERKREADSIRMGEKTRAEFLRESLESLSIQE